MKNRFVTVWRGAAAVATALSLTAASCGSGDEEAILDYGCEEQGKTAVDDMNRPLVCTTVPGKRFDSPTQVRWALDETRRTATPGEVTEALSIAVASGQRAVTGRGSPNLPGLKVACEELQKVAQRAQRAGTPATDPLAAATFCVEEIERVSAANPGPTAVARSLGRLQEAQQRWR
jgi:hypothetical protein